MGRGIVAKGGKPLPTLTRPAGAAQIISGYQAIDQEGALLTGTSTAKVLPTLSNPASSSDIRQGKQAVSQSGSILTGTMPSGVIVQTCKVKFTAGTGASISVTTNNGVLTVLQGESKTVTLYRGVTYAVERYLSQASFMLNVVAGSCSVSGLGYNAKSFIPSGDCELRAW